VTLSGHTAIVQALAFTPDGNTLASGARDGTVLFWSVAKRQQIDSPLLTNGGVNGLTFSGDGKTLATVSSSHNLQLWDVASGQALGPAWDFPGPASALGYLAVDRLPGNRLVTANGSPGPTSVLIWSPLLLSTRLDAFTAALCPTVTHNLTEAEWLQVLPNEPYHATCPGKTP
jgi:WD40 repeat protein